MCVDTLIVVLFLSLFGTCGLDTTYRHSTIMKGANHKIITPVSLTNSFFGATQYHVFIVCFLALYPLGSPAALTCCFSLIRAIAFDFGGQNSATLHHSRAATYVALNSLQAAENVGVVIARVIVHSITFVSCEMLHILF